MMLYLVGAVVPLPVLEPPLLLHAAIRPTVVARATAPIATLRRRRLFIPNRVDFGEFIALPLRVWCSRYCVLLVMHSCCVMLTCEFLVCANCSSSGEHFYALLRLFQLIKPHGNDQDDSDDDELVVGGHTNNDEPIGENDRQDDTPEKSHN